MPTQRGGILNDRNVFTGDATSPARNTVPAGTARVPGVFKNSQGIREETLKRIYWKDTQYTKYTGNYVRYAYIGTRDVHPVADGKDLLTYTHDRSTHYGYDIESRYTPNDVTRRTYETDPVLWNRMWEGNYIDNFNFDTKLERIATLELAKESAIAEYIHNDRHVEVKYITPQLKYYYGTSAGRLKDIGNFFTHGNKTPIRITEAPEGDVRIIDDIHSASYTNKTNKGWDYLMDSLRFAARNGKYDENTDLFDVYFHTYVPYALSNFSSGTRLSLIHLTHPSKTLVSQPISSSGRYGAGRNSKLAYDEMDASPAKASLDLVNTLGKNMGVDPDYTLTDTLADGLLRTNNPKLADYATFLEVPEQPLKERGLLDRTNRLFKEHKLSTLISRFHTTVDENGLNDKQEITDTAKSKRFGNSHGRNLLKIGARVRDYKTNDYENPYCRVWTYHHQYDRFSRMIRPFVEMQEGEDGSETPVVMKQSELYEKNPYTTKYGNGDTGGQYLEKYSVLNKNGYVNIAPTVDEVDIKKCMFSIENLAWKDVPRVDEYLHKSQRGPNGGRIMWFPPYDLDFQESVNVDWNPNKFIGRGEAVYTYANTERRGTLSFSLLIDHPSIINNVAKYNLEGVAPDNDPEGDILRFFAGCGLLGNPKKEEPKEPATKPGESLNNTKEVPSQEGNLIKFYVYYPNNYSGNMTNAPAKVQKVTDVSYTDVTSPTDKDWWKYLLFGKNIDYTERTSDTQGYVGYEVHAEGEWNGITEKSIVEATGIAPNENRITVPIYKTHSYGYRVDSDLKQKLFDLYDNKQPREPMDSNYNDSRSFELNSSLTHKLEGATHTFMEVVYGLELAKNTITESRRQWYGQETDRVKFLASLFKGEQGKYSISVKGAATNQNRVNSLTLAVRRASTVQKFLEETINDPTNAVFVDNGSGRNRTIQISTAESTDDNTLARKRERFAVVEIRYGLPEITNVSDTATANNPDASKDQNAEDAVKKAVEEEKKNEQPTTGTVGEGADETTKRRYEREDEYFKKLKIENRFLYENLTEKFKYFSPAFHSISPEGFNARLTFLQQCTRQGHTIESSSLQGYAMTAGNLSFGRMPVCVLRIGDFINTKVLIDNVSISYSNGGATQWDLNPEGIGVQPMYAKVSLGLHIIGGQSLSGPINRLQNAVSFNYYANTGVYDDRSDIAMPEETKKDVKLGDVSTTVYGSSTKYTHIWTPNPNAK